MSFTTRISNARQLRGEHRRGGMTVLMAIMIPTLIVLGAMAINISYIQLTRTELMIASDAAARAGGRAMSFFQDVEEAKSAAAVTAAMNMVAGEALRLELEDEKGMIEFGDCQPSNSSDRFSFTKIATASLSGAGGNLGANAVRINATAAGVPTLFPTMSTINDFDVAVRSVAMQVDRDISLILDRSGSMNWPTFDWPNGFSPWTPSSLDPAVQAGVLTNQGGGYQYAQGQNSTTYQNWVWEEHLQLGDRPATPWEELITAVDVFLAVLEDTDQSEQVSLATYSNTATLNLDLVSDYALVTSALQQISPSGGTGIGNGMLTGINALTGGNARPFAAKTVIVMTDGMHNSGTSPEAAAQTIVNNNDVTIHTVTFGGGADLQRMQSVAQIGGGTHYHAATGDELVAVFEEIANNLPTLVTK